MVRVTLAGAAAALALGGCASHEHVDDEHDAVMAMHEDDKPAAASWVRDLPETHEYSRLLARPEALALHSGLVTLRPGEDCGWHSTEHYEEMIIVLEGAGELRSEGGLSEPIAAGQYGYNAPWTRHCVFNTGPDVMRYIYIVAPALPEDSGPPHSGHEEEESHHEDQHEDQHER